VNFLASFEKRSKLIWTVVGFVLIGGVGIFDYLTGYEFAFSFFYLIPVFLVTWLTGRRLGMAASVASAFVWLITEMASGHSYSQWIVYAWNTLIVFSFFVVVALLLSALIKSLENERELTRTDDLTGAANRRFFFELLQMEIDRSQRYIHPFTIAYIDIDNFKEVNDRFGHTTGDRVLRGLVDLARKHLRKTDMVARLGGDEFGVLLPETDQESAQVVLSKIRSEISEGVQQSIWPVMVSIGVLTCVDPKLTTVEIVRMVDDLMYSVKRDSKNGIKYSTYTGQNVPAGDGEL
jgi:diguanylate cyclase (GGDEF)-like protein